MTEIKTILDALQIILSSTHRAILAIALLAAAYLFPSSGTTRYSHVKPYTARYSKVYTAIVISALLHASLSVSGSVIVSDFGDCYRIYRYTELASV